MSNVQTNIPIEYPANPSVEPQLKRAFMALEDRNFSKASEMFERVLDEAPECAFAYLGLFLKSMEISRMEDCFDFFLLEGSTDKNLCRARQFSEGALKAWFEEKDRQKEEKAAMLSLGLKRAAAARRSIAVDGDRIIAEKADGTILSSDGATNPERVLTVWEKFGEEKCVIVNTDGRAKVYEGGYGEENVTRSWTGIEAAALMDDSKYFPSYWLLKEDGTLIKDNGEAVARCGHKFGNIISFAPEGYWVAFLNAYGRVMVLNSGQFDVSNWQDIVAIAIGEKCVVGLKADGTLVVEGECKGKERVASWKLFDSIDTLAEERKQHTRDALQKDIDRFSDKLVALAAEEDRIQEELSNLKGLFTGSKRKELEHRLEVIGNDQRFTLKKVDELEAKMKNL